MAEIPADAAHLLEGQHFAHIATLKDDGSPQVSPVWIDHEEPIHPREVAVTRSKSTSAPPGGGLPRQRDQAAVCRARSCRSSPIRSRRLVPS